MFNFFSLGLKQSSPNSVLEGRCPAEFNSNPDQTHLSMSLQILKTLISLLRCVWSGLELNSLGTVALQDRDWGTLA